MHIHTNNEEETENQTGRDFYRETKTEMEAERVKHIWRGMQKERQDEEMMESGQASPGKTIET